MLSSRARGRRVDRAKRARGEKTLLTSVILSAPGPIVVGIGLFLGRSSTQLADFVRRTAELAAIVVSYVVFRAVREGGKSDTERGYVTTDADFEDGASNAACGGEASDARHNGEVSETARVVGASDATCADAYPDEARKGRLERRANRCVGGAMCLSGAAMAFIALLSDEARRGNVIPGLVIALLGATTNTWFWLRYRGLDREAPDAILAVQGRLYRAKSLVDGCVAAALTVVALAPGSPAARYMDLGGSAVVSAYLIASGFATIRAVRRDAPRAA